MFCCPICGLLVANQGGLATHFRHQSNSHPDYQEWCDEQKWAGKEETVDYVRCRICGFRSASLARHLKAIHQITADEYRALCGEDAVIRASATEARRRKAIREERQKRPPLVKTLPCSVCGKVVEVSAYSSQTTCVSCRQEAKDSLWSDKSEPEDYVTCLDCGYRAENLTSHLQHEHPHYRERHPDALVVALRSSVRDKGYLKGRVLSAEIRQRMSENAGRWNRGLTKEDHPSLAAQASKMLGKTPWSKGLSVDQDERLQKARAKLRLYIGDKRPWRIFSADLTRESFEPFLDVDGCVDRKAMSRDTGFCEETVSKYMKACGLRVSFKYVRLRASNSTIRLDKDILLHGALSNGKISVARVMRNTGHSFSVVQRECVRHGLEISNRRGQQTLCLDAISEALGGLPYRQEWRSWKFTNPVTGRRFKFDGFFHDVGLVVEFHGHQHFVFPNAFMQDESYRSLWLAMLERDRMKQELIEKDKDLTYLMVRYDEPFTDVSYLKGRLVQMGAGRLKVPLL